MPTDPYQDHEAIRSLIQRKLAEWSRGREVFTRAAHRNVLFGRGHQWIIWSAAQNRFRPAVLKRNTPRPVTNLFASTLSAFISVLARIQPVLKFPPATQEPEDQATSDVAERVIEVIETEVDLGVIRQHLATWNGYTGGVWLETGYDNDPIHGSRLIQHERCVACGAVQPPTNTPCAQCGGQLLIPAIDAAGAPIGESAPRGRLYVDVVPLFEMYFDPAVTPWTKQREYLRERAIDLDLAKRRWPALAEVLRPDATTLTHNFYGESLARLGPSMDSAEMWRAHHGPSRQLSNTRVTEQWYWSLPDETYPDGLLAVILSKTHVGYAGPLPYTALEQDGSRTPFLPHVFFPQQLVPGSGWPKTVADDLAAIAMLHNRLTAMLEMILMRSSNPVWLKPTGSNVTNLTGEPGQVIEYNALGPSPAKPERIQGSPLPAGMLHYLAKVEHYFEELAATFDIIKGNKPPNVSAGISLQLLQERAQSRFGPMFLLWEAAWVQWASQALEIFRAYATEDRLLQIKGRDGAWEVQKFLGADLRGRVNVRAEAGSAFPRSSLAARAEVEQLIATGVINPQEPEIQFKILQLFGHTDLLPGLAADTKQAYREQEQWRALAEDERIGSLSPAAVSALQVLPDEEIAARFLALGIQLPRVKPAIDDHGVHAREHRIWAKSEAFSHLPHAIQVLVERHIAEHSRLAAIQMQAMVAARIGTNPTAGLLSNPGGSPMRVESGPGRLDGEGREQDEALARTEPP